MEHYDISALGGIKNISYDQRIAMDQRIFHRVAADGAGANQEKGSENNSSKGDNKYIKLFKNALNDGILFIRFIHGYFRAVTLQLVLVIKFRHIFFLSSGQ